MGLSRCLCHDFTVDFGNIVIPAPFDPNTAEGEFLLRVCEPATFEDFKDVPLKAPNRVARSPTPSPLTFAKMVSTPANKSKAQRNASASASQAPDVPFNSVNIVFFFFFYFFSLLIMFPFRGVQVAVRLLPVLPLNHYPLKGGLTPWKLMTPPKMRGRLSRVRPQSLFSGPLLPVKPYLPVLVCISSYFSFLLFILHISCLGSTRSHTAGKAPPKKAATSRPNKGKKRAVSPAGSEISVARPSKRAKANKVSESADPGADNASFDLASCAAMFVDLVPQMSRLIATLGEVPYEHPALATNPGFKSGIPAKTMIPVKESTASRRVLVKRAPAWKLVPDVQSFGPYFKAGGISYSPQDLSSLARAVPDVSLLFQPSFQSLSHVSFHFTDCQSDLWTLSVLLFVWQGF